MACSGSSPTGSCAGTEARGRAATPASPSRRRAPVLSYTRARCWYSLRRCNGSGEGCPCSGGACRVLHPSRPAANPSDLGFPALVAASPVANPRPSSRCALLRPPADRLGRVRGLRFGANPSSGGRTPRVVETAAFMATRTVDLPVVVLRRSLGHAFLGMHPLLLSPAHDAPRATKSGDRTVPANAARRSCWSHPRFRAP